jgi:hypothetical protein
VVAHHRRTLNGLHVALSAHFCGKLVLEIILNR